jgi:hypothetical protein
LLREQCRETREIVTLQGKEAKFALAELLFCEDTVEFFGCEKV